MSLVNETWSRYVPPQHLPLAGKLGWQLKDGGGGWKEWRVDKKSHEKMR